VSGAQLVDSSWLRLQQRRSWALQMLPHRIISRSRFQRLHPTPNPSIALNTTPLFPPDPSPSLATPPHPQALGVAIDLGPEGVARCVDLTGVGFMFAPRYHPAMKVVRPVRSALKVGGCGRRPVVGGDLVLLAAGC